MPVKTSAASNRSQSEKDLICFLEQKHKKSSSRKQTVNNESKKLNIRVLKFSLTTTLVKGNDLTVGDPGFLTRGRSMPFPDVLTPNYYLAIFLSKLLENERNGTERRAAHPYRPLDPSILFQQWRTPAAMFL